MGYIPPVFWLSNHTEHEAVDFGVSHSRDNPHDKRQAMNNFAA